MSKYCTNKQTNKKKEKFPDSTYHRSIRLLSSLVATPNFSSQQSRYHTTREIFFFFLTVNKAFQARLSAANLVKGKPVVAGFVEPTFTRNGSLMRSWLLRQQKCQLLMEEMGTPKGAPKSYTQNEMDLYLPIYNPAICFSLCPLPCPNLAGGYIRTKRKNTIWDLKRKIRNLFFFPHWLPM